MSIKTSSHQCYELSFKPPFASTFCSTNPLWHITIIALRYGIFTFIIREDKCQRLFRTTTCVYWWSIDILTPCQHSSCRIQLLTSNRTQLSCLSRLHHYRSFCEGLPAPNLWNTHGGGASPAQASIDPASSLNFDATELLQALGKISDAYYLVNTDRAASLA